MATATTAGRNGAASPPTMPTLPPITVAKLREAFVQLDELVGDSAQAFIEHGQSYREQHREATSRPLTAVEVAEIAAGLQAPLAQVKKEIDKAKLTGYDEADPTEVRYAGLAGITDEALTGVLRLTALVEMTNDQFAEACEAGGLGEALDAKVTGYDGEDVAVMRERAGRAWEHLSIALGHTPGKAWGLIAKMLWTAVSQGMSQLAATSSSMPSTASPPSTDGPDATSSTTPPG